MFTNKQILLKGDMEKVIRNRHSVRKYLDRPLEPGKVTELRNMARRLSALSQGVRLEVHVDSPDAFGRSFMARYGGFRGVSNYIVVIIKRDDKMGEPKAGFYGEQMVLLAQQLGLNTCWVGLTYSKKRSGAETAPDEKVCAVIALGYGETQGVPHKSQAPEKVAPGYENAPLRFKRGIDWALLAPTALNQQRFRFKLFDDGRVSITPGRGFFTRVDLGIAWLHFMLATR